jgi:O-acetyl-ADP-ribose deacetylase (regulator of RNase III)
MGAGIAVEFKNRFGSVDLLKSQNKMVGQCASLVRSSDNLLVSYLITKENYWGKPTYGTLEAALKDFRQHALDHDVRTIAMPKIGCGLDRLNWDKVKSMIVEILQGFEVIIYYL